ncbi:hypothetical protein ACFYYN_39265 [Streptomyces sp. NPDC001902]
MPESGAGRPEPRTRRCGAALPEHTLIAPDGKSVLPDAIERAVRLPCCVLWLDKDGDNLGGTGETANKLGVGMVHTGNTVPPDEEITNGKVSGNRSVKVVDVEQTPTAG